MEEFYTASIEQTSDEIFGCFTVIDRPAGFAIPCPPAEVVSEEVTA